MESIDPTPAELLDLLPEWELALAAENKTSGTIEAYLGGTRRYLDWCSAAGAAPMFRRSLQTWMAHLLQTGSAAGTVLARKQSVKRFCDWLLAIGRVPGHPLPRRQGAGPASSDRAPALRRRAAPHRHLHPPGPPTLRETAPPTRRGPDPAHTRDRHPSRRGRRPRPRHPRPRRPRLDIHWITVRRGKGGHLRTIPVRASTIAAIRGYLPERDQHPGADGPRLWLGERGATFGYDGLNQALRRRARHAGINGFHLHRLRHTAAHRWLAAGGSESGLMAMAGCSRTDMLVRYIRATAAERAAAEALRLDLGEHLTTSSVDLLRLLRILRIMYVLREEPP